MAVIWGHGSQVLLVSKASILCLLIQYADLISHLGHGFIFRENGRNLPGFSIRLHVSRNTELHKSNNITRMVATSINGPTGNDYLCKVVLVIGPVNLSEQYCLLLSFRKKSACLPR